MADHRLDIDELRRRVACNSETGVLTWKSDPPRGRRVGEALASHGNGNGYVYATFNRRSYGVHRLVWAVVTGEWPRYEIDHIDCNKGNNGLKNLRLATRSQNECNKATKRNNTSGYKGVGWHKCKSRWRAYIQANGKHISLGYHATPELAHEAYKQAAANLHGNFARAS